MAPVDVPPRVAGAVVAAPGRDDGTAEIAAEVARRTGFGLVVGDRGDAVDERRVREAADGTVALYVEIRGREGADRIDVATAGVDADQALRLRTLFELVRDAHLRGRPRLRLSVAVAPADGHVDLGRLSARALRIELPRAARREGRDVYTEILADFLRAALALPPADR